MGSAHPALLNLENVQLHLRWLEGLRKGRRKRGLCSA
jgi:hypothetical protein